MERATIEAVRLGADRTMKNATIVGGMGWNARAGVES